MIEDMAFVAFRKCGCLVAVSLKTDDREAKNKSLIKDWEQRGFKVNWSLAIGAVPRLWPCKDPESHSAR